MELPQLRRINLKVASRKGTDFAAAFMWTSLSSLQSRSHKRDSARCQWQVHDCQQSANNMYDKALLLDPDNLQALLNKAGLLLLTGKKEESKQYIREVLKRDKTNVTAQTLLKQL